MRERKVKIAGWGNTLSGKKIEFDGQTRYRLDKDETLLMLAVRSARKALERAAMDISDMDCIVCALSLIHIFHPTTLSGKRRWRAGIISFTGKGPAQPGGWRGWRERPLPTTGSR